MEDIPRLIAVLEERKDQDSRVALVQAVAQKVMSVEDVGGFVESDLPRLLELDGRMEGLYRDMAGEWWETALVLDALHPTESTKRFLALIVEKTDPGDLVTVWETATKALLTYSEPSPGFVAKIFEVEDKPLQLLDSVKAACCLGLARLLTDLPVPAVQQLVTTGLEDYLLLMCKEMDEAYKYLRTEYFTAVLTAFHSKVTAFHEDPHYLPGLKAATILLGLLSDSDALEHNRPIMISIILGLGKDLHSLLITWRAWFVVIFKPNESSDLHNYSAKGVAMLTYMSIQDTTDSQLHLPCVFSSLYRLQVFIPIANLVFYTHPEVAFALLDHAISHFTGQFRSIKSPFLLVPDNRQSTAQFIRELLDLLSRTEDPTRKSRISYLFGRFLSFFTDAVSTT